MFVWVGGAEEVAWAGWGAGGEGSGGMAWGGVGCGGVRGRWRVEERRGMGKRWYGVWAGEREAPRT